MAIALDVAFGGKCDSRILEPQEELSKKPPTTKRDLQQQMKGCINKVAAYPLCDLKSVGEKVRKCGCTGQSSR